MLARAEKVKRRNAHSFPAICYEQVLRRYATTKGDLSYVAGLVGSPAPVRNTNDAYHRHSGTKHSSLPLTTCQIRDDPDRYAATCRNPDRYE